KVKTILVSGAFRKDQIFFKWYASFFRKMLGRFEVLTVQDEVSQELLLTIGFSSKLTGDTRYDRVVAIAAQADILPKIELFKGENKLVIAGSTWLGDEQALKASLEIFPENWKLILAPHEINSGHLHSIKNLFGKDCISYSEFERSTDAKVLIIDNIGMLSSLYRYGEIACIGGGFDQGGIHNILEPAVFGLPVIFGPAFEKFSEAREMVAAGFAFPVNDAESYSRTIKKLMVDGLREPLQGQIKQFVLSKTGATQKILKLIEHAK
ncbi:MAG: glycosyltransferase N-terminal domain-containing protein, partial [Chitinophagaceae bacterium]